MPLVRVEVRNEYALGASELYGEANEEDPREILEGVAVAGLVGVLRQLGDLADFAAEVFHGLQEELMMTSSRSSKLRSRVQRIEAVFSPLEKVALAQRTHLHFAYAAGLNWHVHIRCQKNHIVYSNVPHFIMDAYEDCQDPPNLYLLDRFDPGGPGSCLKRYSDPTFFKRASVASGEANAEKISKDKKGYRIKKRRSWHKNGDVHRDASFSYNNGRVQLTQRNIGGHPSPSQAASMLISVLDEQSNMYLRNGSDYTDGDARPNHSVQHEEQHARESLSSPVNRDSSNVLDFKILDNKNANAYYEIQINLSQDQAACSPSSVISDPEKGEILEHMGQESDNSHMALEDESFSPNLNLQTLSDNASNFETVDRMDDQSFWQVGTDLESSDVRLESTESCNKLVLVQESSDGHLNDIESCNQAGPTLESFDVHLDDLEYCGQAVPTLESSDVHVDDIESESDNYVDALNTIESEGETDVDYVRNQVVEDCSKIVDKGAQYAACELICHNLECQSSITESFDFTNSSPSNASCRHLISVSPDSPYETKCLANEVAMKDEVHSVPLVDNALRSSHMAGKSLNPISEQSVVSFTVSSDFRDSRSGTPMADEAQSSLDSHKNASHSSSATSVTFWTNGGLLGLRPSKPPDFSVLKGVPKDAVFNKDENFQTGNSTLQVVKKHQENSRSSSTMHELSSGKKLLTDADENSYRLGYRTTDPFEQRNYQCVEHGPFSRRRKYLLGGNISMLSPPPSPPLEHMKLSFQPIHAFQTSKLKLKFPDGNTDCGSSDIYPSFQLVPEVCIPQDNVGSDSDADTFNRSSPSLSDDCRSNLSESDSEQWESSQSVTNKDYELYSALRGISLTESVSTVPESEASPAAPPLPPVQWQGTASHLNGTVSDDSYHTYDPIHSASSFSHPKPAPSNEDHIGATNMPKSKPGLRMTNGQQQDNPGKSIDGNDFLHLIRTKSFNLRPTSTAKPMAPVGASVHVQVTAILEKANAIRRAVGSEEEDDGDWSD